MKTKKILVVTGIMLGMIFKCMAQTIPSYVPTNGLVGWWPFNGNANDESGNGNHGTVNGATLTNNRIGLANSAYLFSSNFIEVMASNSLNNPQGTINFWMNSTDQSSIMIPIKKNNYLGAQNEQFTIAINYVNLLSVKYNSSCQPGVGWVLTGGNNPILTNGNWHMVTTTYASTINVYIDANLISSINAPSPNADLCNGNLQIGRGWSSFPQFFNGKLDDIGIWNRALTQQEITALYNAVNCASNTSITPQTNYLTTGSTATFTATTSDSNPSYVWQSDFGQGYVSLNNFGNYSGTNTATLNLSNVQLSNHNQPIRVITTSGNCIDTSNVAIISITDTCINTITDTTLITVTDTLLINTTITSLNPPNNANTIKVFPNPANDHITIHYGNFSLMNGYQLRIQNSLGQQVFQTNITQQSDYLSLNNWGGNGLYFVHLIDPQGNTIDIRKIVLQ